MESDSQASFSFPLSFLQGSTQNHNSFEQSDANNWAVNYLRINLGIACSAVC